MEAIVMRHLFTLLLVAVLAAPASAQWLGLNGSATPTNIDACVSVSPGGMASPYVLVTGNIGGTTGAQFSVTAPGCAGVTFVSATALGGFLVIGNLASGFRWRSAGVSAPSISRSSGSTIW
jgi:hypothetical protein